VAGGCPPLFKTTFMAEDRDDDRRGLLQAVVVLVLAMVGLLAIIWFCMGKLEIHGVKIGRV
jgi:hypothetical protein